jgi:hypothetical protein
MFNPYRAEGTRGNLTLTEKKTFELGSPGILNRILGELEPRSTGIVPLEDCQNCVHYYYVSGSGRDIKMTVFKADTVPGPLKELMDTACK